MNLIVRPQDLENYLIGFFKEFYQGQTYQKL